jgi:hypothetical protein
MKKYDFASLKMYQELNDWCSDHRLINLAKACIEAQKQAAASVFQTTFKPDRQAAADAVSEEKLESIIKSGRDVHGISRERSISNVIAFNSRNVEDSVFSGEVKRLRMLVDQAVSEKIKKSLKARQSLAVANSGHFWYPPGAYMAWHTNSGAPGLRMYISHAEEPGKSFFRYRDPDTKEIITSMDNEWNIRIFEIRSDKLLWHAVYSDTNRFSLGYMIYPRDFKKSISQTLKRLLKI